jgi:hypothetical protein
MKARTVVALCTTMALFAVVPAHRLAAQQSQLDVHGDYQHTVSSGSNSWGAGVALPVTWGSKGAAVRIATSPGFDWTKQTSGGPSQESLSLDVTAQPGGDSPITPYAGGSASANWSTGTGKQWEGSKLGLEALAGLQMTLQKDKLSAKVEERYGYIFHNDHMWTTRAGLLFSL